MLSAHHGHDRPPVAVANPVVRPSALARARSRALINYDAGPYQGYIVRLIRPDDSLSAEVVGIADDSPAEIAAASHCRAYIASR